MQKFFKIWIFSSFFYLASIVSANLLWEKSFIAPLFILLQLCNICACIMILYGCCVFDNIPMHKFWGRYALVLIFCGVILEVVELGIGILQIPVYIFELCVIGFIADTVLRKWRCAFKIKIVLSLVLGSCNLYMIFCSYLLTQEVLTQAGIYLYIAMLLLLNFAFAYLYKLRADEYDAFQDTYLHSMAEDAVDIIFYYVLEPYHRFAFISPSVEKQVGYSPEAFYKNAQLHLELTLEEDRGIVHNAFSNRANSVTRDIVRWQRKDGESIYLEFHNTPITSAGKTVAIEGVFRDVTERKLFEQEMIEAKKSRQILLSYISHDLKTPITYILGYSEALQKGLLTSEDEKRNVVDLIVSKTIFLQHLVEDLSQLSKMEANQFSFEYTQVKVHDLYRYLNEEHHRDFIDAEICYIAQIEKEVEMKYEVLADLYRVRQVFSNLLSNAIKYTPKGGTISFHCGLDPKKQNAIFRIEDSGAGIAKEDIPYVFRRFYKGKKLGVESVEGSGLGLSIARQIILSHQGTIEVTSEVGKGSTFVFKIPLYTEEAK